jgi:hypothetical protein
MTASASAGQKKERKGRALLGARRARKLTGGVGKKRDEDPKSSSGHKAPTVVHLSSPPVVSTFFICEPRGE